MWPVMTREGNGILLDNREVVSIERSNRDIVYHTRTNEYLHITAIDLLSEAIQPLGFEILFGGKVVNLHNVKWFDMTNNIVYFDEKITGNSKWVKVSRDYLPIIRKYVQEHRSEVNTFYFRDL